MLIAMLIDDTGRLLIEGVDSLQRLVRLGIGVTIAVILGLLLFRYIPSILKLNPFGRTSQAFHRPTNEMIYHMRRSRFYSPLRRTLGFDPSVLMVLIALAILWYVLTGVLQNLFFIIQGIGLTLTEFGAGAIFSGVRYLIGSAILAVIFFLMGMMTIVFVNWLFGLLHNIAGWSLNRLAPLLNIFEFGGAFAGWSFMILWIALSFAATAVEAVFF